jgi:hypothetical protein
MLDRAVCHPVGTARDGGLYMSLVKLQLQLQLHIFVIPTAEYAGISLLKMGKECPKHV